MALNLIVSAHLYLVMSSVNDLASSITFGSNKEGGKKIVYRQLEMVW